MYERRRRGEHEWRRGERKKREKEVKVEGK